MKRRIHKKIVERGFTHPLFKKEFLKENLVSLAQTLTLLVVVFFIAVLLLRYLLLETGYNSDLFMTSSLIITTSDYILYNFDISQDLKTEIVFFVGVLAVLYIYLRRLFEKQKAKIHPKGIGLKLLQKKEAK